MAPKRPASVVFIHGLAKKPAPDALKDIWLWGLGRDNPMPTVFAPPNAGVDLPTQGIPQRFNYYADVFYGTDYEADTDAYYESNEGLEIASERLDRVEPDLALPKPVTPREHAFLANFEAKLAAHAALAPAPAGPATAVGANQLEIASWLPDAVKQAVIKKAAMEAFYFLFDKEYVRPGDGATFTVRQELRSRLLTELVAAQQEADKVVVVSHSMGTMVAYDVLRNCRECPPVSTLITLGSPLGIREVEDELIAADADDVDFPARTLGSWINVYDPLDPVCGADPTLANDYAPVDGKHVVDVRESNWGGWRHTITHYLAGSQFRAHLTRAIG